MSELQDTFNRVARHLLAQNRVSSNGENCLYRGPGGTRCAVGCVIDDKHYCSRLEGRTVGSEEVRRALVKSGVPYRWEIFAMLSDLQTVHDYWGVSDWRTRLSQVAAAHDVSDEVLHEN